MSLVFISRLGSCLMDAFLISTSSVAIAEIGDKTQLLSLLLAAKFRNKLAIVAGIFVATVLNHAASAWFGQWLIDYLALDWGQYLVSGSFIAVGLWLLIPDKDDGLDERFDRYGAFVVTLILFFLAEIGDKTQIATVLLGAQYQAVLWVTLGSTLGMMLANVPVVYLGHQLMARLPLNLSRLLAAILFIAVGVVGIFTIG